MTRFAIFARVFINLINHRRRDDIVNIIIILRAT